MTDYMIWGIPRFLYLNWLSSESSELRVPIKASKAGVLKPAINAGF
jgi:hypothetical protein